MRAIGSGKKAPARKTISKTVSKNTGKTTGKTAAANRAVRELPPSRPVRVYRWFKARPPERVPWAIAPALYLGGGMLHAADLPWWEGGVGGAAAGFGVYAAVRRNTGDEVLASKAAGAIGAAGVWLGLSADYGLGAGPHGMLSLAYWGLYAIAYGVFRMDDGVRTKIADRKEEEAFERLLPALGLEECRLQKHEPTRLGFKLVIDTRPSGKRASSFVSKDLQERIAEHYRIPMTRVHVGPHRIPGAIEIKVKTRDPWSQPLAHPMLDAEAEIELPAVADAREPLVIGMDPDTGNPLKMVVWNKQGAAHWVIVGIKGSGKTVLLNNVLERLTAADNVFTVLIDPAKGKDGLRWREAGALGMSALGPEEIPKALAILEFWADAVSYRSKMNAQPVFEVGPGRPLVMILIDEIDKLFKKRPDLAPRFQAALAILTSTSRSESIGMILCGQRGTAAYLGGPDTRANIDRFALGKVQRLNEALHVLGEFGLEAPDMSNYGEGHPGVWLLADDANRTEMGRSFNLTEFADIDRLAEGRRPADLEPGLVEWAGDHFEELVTVAATTDENGERKPPPPPRGARRRAAPGTAGDPLPGDDVTAAAPPDFVALDAEVEAGLPPDLKAQRDAMASRHQTIMDRLTPIPDPADFGITEEQAREAFAARARQAAEQTDIAPEHRAAVMALLKKGPASMAEIRQAVGLGDVEEDGEAARKKNGARRKAAGRMMARLRDLEKVVRSEGNGAAARWFLVDNASAESDSQ
ncbi:ATP-binding protein [Actinomadura violacea]|uniref:AAA family ATPase n=1 Tax=Actinomadura violacea TaxID=2819934 RepID=A0ABS3S048_9ACTN|nr:AAA family ATPase [Actinomadura violacea]MBO2461635.1 AAA family ATPase [Actinomadura violacea]